MGWGGWSGRVDKAAYLSIVVTLVSCIGPAPAYNVVLPYFALVCTHTRQGKQVLALVVGLFISLVTDALWALFNHGRIDKTLVYFAVLCLAANMLIKAFLMFCAAQLFIDLGGTFSLTDPGVPIDNSSRSGSFGHAHAPSFGSEADGAGGAGAASFRSYQHPTDPEQSHGSL